MEAKRIICTVCPKGCAVNVEIENGQIVKMEGYGCKRGIKYAGDECVNPVRTLTTTVRIQGGKHPVAPVKSAAPIPKNMLRECVIELNKLTVKAPLKIGEVIVHDILGTGVDIVTAAEIEAAQIEDAQIEAAEIEAAV